MNITEMDPALLAALIAGGGTIIGAFVAGRMSHANEALKARQAYEFEARKRLYTEAEPLLYQVESAASAACDRAFNLARAARDGKLGAGLTSWVHQEGYYIASTLHAFLRPAALARLLERRLTLVDLSLDRRKAMLVALLREYQVLLSADFSLAQAEPRLHYHPDDRSETPIATTGDAFRQGLVAGRREAALDAMIFSTPGESGHVMSFGEFEDAFNSEHHPLRMRLAPLTIILRDFHPRERPVFWRILLAKALLGRVIQRTLEDGRKPGRPYTLLKKLMRDQKLIAALNAEIGDAPDSGALTAAFDYLRPRLRRIERRYR